MEYKSSTLALVFSSLSVRAVQSMSGSDGFPPSASPTAAAGASPHIFDSFLSGTYAAPSAAGARLRRSLDPQPGDPRFTATPNSAPRAVRAGGSAALADRDEVASVRARHAQLFADNAALYGDVQTSQAQLAHLSGAYQAAVARAAQLEADMRRRDAEAKIQLQQAQLDSDRRVFEVERLALEARLSAPGAGSPGPQVLQVVLPTDHQSRVSQALLPAYAPEFRKAYLVDDRCTVQSIDLLAVALTDMVASVTGAGAYIASLFGALHLPGARHMRVVPGGDVARAQAEIEVDPGLVSGDEGSDDGCSVVSSVRSSRSAAASVSVKADIFSGRGGGKGRAWFQALVRHVSTAGTGTRLLTAAWYALDSQLVAVLRTLLAQNSVVVGLKHKASTFVGLLELLLRGANHSTVRARTDIFHDCIGRPSYTVAADWSLRAWLMAFHDELVKRRLALQEIQECPWECVTKIAAKFTPTATARKQQIIDDFKQELAKHAPTMTFESLQALVDTALEECGDEDPAGQFVPCPALFPDFGPTKVAPAAAGLTATPGGGKGKGKGGGKPGQAQSEAGGARPVPPQQGSASLPSPPPAKAPPSPGKGPGKPPHGVCPNGAACDRLGTMNPCEYRHPQDDYEACRRRLGAQFISATNAWRARCLAAERVPRPAAAAELPAVPSPAPALPVASSSPSPPTVDSVSDHLAKLLAHVRGGDSSDARPAVAALPILHLSPASGVLAAAGPTRGEPAYESVGREQASRLASVVALPLSETARGLICHILEAYYAWSCLMLVSLREWNHAPASWRSAYLSSHAGLTPLQEHAREGLRWRQLVEAMRTGLVDGGVAAPVASAVAAACEKYVLFDSGSADSLGNGTGLSLQPCEPHVAVTADAGRLVTNEQFAYQFFTKDTRGRVYCISYDKYRHVPGLGQRDKAPFIIMSPTALLQTQSIWNNTGLDKCYVRIRYMPVGGDEPVYSGRIPIDWRTLGASIFVTVPESAVDQSTVIPIHLEELESLCDRPVRPTACMGIPFSPSVPAAKPLPPNSPITPLSHDSDSDDESVRPLTSAVVASAGPSDRDTDSDAEPASAGVPSARPPASAVSPVVLHFGSFPACRDCSAVVMSPGAVLCSGCGCVPGGSARPAVPAAESAPARSVLADAPAISSSDAGIVAAIDRNTAEREWQGALDVSVGASRTVQAHWQEVAAASRAAARASAQGPDGVSGAVYRGAFMALVDNSADISRGDSPRSRASVSSAAASAATPHGSYRRSRAPARRPPNPRRPPRAIVVLCACPSSSGSGGCIRQVVDGSQYCSQCVPDAAASCPCAARTAVVPPVVVPVAPSVESVRYVWDVCCGVSLAYTIERLQSHPGLMAFATDILPADEALANIRQDHPELLSRVVYLQVPAGHLPTRAWLDDAMLRYCGVSAKCIIESSVGTPCGSFSTRHGRHPPRNPHRIHFDGQWRPVTLEAAQTDRFRTVLFDTFRSLRATNAVYGCMLENPATSLLWEQPDVHQFIADVCGQVAVVDHCVVATEPTDLAHGVSNKPSTWVFPAGAWMPDEVRCRELSCLHKLPGTEFHRLVIQRPPRASAAYLAGQRQVPEGRAACVPVGLYRVLSLERWCPADVVRQLATPCVPPPVPLSSVSASAVPAAAAARSLPRLTPEACVYTAETLHAIFGHVVTGARLCDTVNQFKGFRMRRHDGSVVCAPHVTIADVTLSGHCSVCPITQLKDVGSRHGSHRRRRSVASPATASVPVVSFQLRGQP